MKSRMLLILFVFLATLMFTSHSPVQAQNQASPQIRTARVNIDFTQPAEVAQKSNVTVTTNGVELLTASSSGEVVSQEIKVPIDAPEPFLALSATWRAELGGSAQAFAYVRTRTDTQEWGEWISIENDSDSDHQPDEFGGALLLLSKDAKYIQLKVELKDPSASPFWISSMNLFFISPGATDRNVLKPVQVQPDAIESDLTASALQKPSVVSRTAWGCAEGQSSPSWPPQYTTVTHLIIHHTVNANTSSDWPAVVRAIWTEHAKGRAWGDIGYNYLIDPNGVIYEGRAGGDNVIGAHFSCANSNTMGVAALGTFTSVSPTQSALDSLKKLLAWKAEQRSIDPLGTTFHPSTQLSLRNISGHRDGNGTTAAGTCDKGTVCPGDNLYAQLTTIRNDVKNLMSGTCSIVPGQGTSGAEFTTFQNAYNQAGGRNVLGCATTQVRFDGFTSFTGTIGHYQTFTNGDIEYHVNGSQMGKAFALVNPFSSKWADLGYVTSNPLGYPTTVRVTGGTSCAGNSHEFQTFEGGSLTHHLSGARNGLVYEVHGAIHAKWSAKGFANCPLGLPTSDERNASSSGASGKTGRVSDFERGHIHWWTGASQAFETHGLIDNVYTTMGGTGSWLGFPTSDEYVASTGRARSDFEGGYITTTDGITYQAFSNNCSYSLSSTSRTFSASGGSSSVGVTAGTGCGWTAVSNSSFITVTSGNSGSGNGTVGYSVASNSGGQRSGTITIAGKTFTVSQDPASTGSKAVMTSPAIGSTFNSNTVTFNWTSGTGATGYWLYLGSSPGAADLLDQNQGTALSRTVTGLPTDGRFVYATLWSFVSSLGGWVNNQYSYKASTIVVDPVSKAVMISPANGSTFSSGTVTFNWNAGFGASGYWLYLGSSPGANDLLDQNQGTGLSRTVSGLPTDGRLVYATLWSYVSAMGGWVNNQYSYKASSIVDPSTGKAQMISPSNGATFTAGTVTFNWSKGSATNYWLYLGSNPGGADLYNQDQGTSLSRTVNGLPTDGRKIYATLWSYVASLGGWVTNQYTYTASGASTGSAYTLSVPTSARPGTIIPVNWTAPSGHSANDWCGLYRPGTSDTSFISFQYISTATSGTLNFVAPATVGSYEFRCYLNNGYSRVATSNVVNVSP